LVFGAEQQTESDMTFSMASALAVPSDIQAEAR
jgi:hypothetical protein